METARITKLYQTRELDAIKDFILTYQNRVYRLTLSILDDPHEAEDATQEVFIAVYNGMKDFRCESTVYTWLYSITVNTCLNRKRSRKRWDRLIERLRESFSISGSVASSAERIAIQNETDAAVWRAIKSLGEKHRLPVVLRYYHDLTVSEIAEILNVKEGTVHSRLNVARKRLRALLNEVDL